jgi:hypothetical protein
MCDYSLCGIPNRLAVEGEELVVHRFTTGSMGLASVADLRVCERIKKAVPKKTMWQKLKTLFEQPGQFATPPAVCIPPGAQLIVRNIPGDLQRRFRVSQEEAAVFTQISSEFNSYRDAVRFPGGGEVRLQDLREGIPVQVLALEGTSEYAPPALTVDNLV